jgi:hypothetical protein
MSSFHQRSVSDLCPLRKQFRLRKGVGTLTEDTSTNLVKIAHGGKVPSGSLRVSAQIRRPSSVSLLAIGRMVIDQGLVGVPGNADFLERSCFEKNAHLLQQVHPILFDLMTPVIGEHPFGHHSVRFQLGVRCSVVAILRG